MAIKITDECINCGACEPECPNNAIYEGGAEWRFSDGTSVKGQFTGFSGFTADADAEAALIGQPATMDTFNAVADILLQNADPKKDNAFKVPLARRTLIATLKELCGKDVA